MERKTVLLMIISLLSFLQLSAGTGAPLPNKASSLGKAVTECRQNFRVAIGAEKAIQTVNATDNVSLEKYRTRYQYNILKKPFCA